MTGEEARRRFGTQPVARLATADPAGRPHLVPVVFVLADPTIYTAVDAKRKRHTALRRLANVAANPRVAVLVDHYEDDWRALWWVRADGRARVLDTADGEARAALERLVDRYPQYRVQPPPGPVLAIDVDRWSGWSADGR